MKYKNAKEIFSENLLKQIQKYVSGEVIYIPAGRKKKSWGETSGYQLYLKERNAEIKEKFLNGAHLEELAVLYSLSFDSIKRIVYQKKEEEIMQYQCSLSSAIEYAKAEKLDEWVHIYLQSDGHNQVFSDGLKLFDRYYIGPLKMPTNLFTRCCGPEENMKYRIDPEWWKTHVNDLKKVLEENSDMPPLIVHYADHSFELNDGNHRFEAYTQLKITEIPVIVWITEPEEYEEFQQKYDKYCKEAITIRR